MTSIRTLVALCTVGLTLLALPLIAGATPPPVAGATSTFTYTKNLKPLGYSPRIVETRTGQPGNGSFNSDLAFWGKTAVQGTYAGFRLIDVSAPANPKEIVNWEECNSLLNTQGNQGDVIVWDDLIIRSWNSPAPAGGSMCGDLPVPAGQEGVHIIDISNPTSPDVLAFVPTPCGSHTETLVPDLANNRLLVYSNPSSGNILGGDPGSEQPISCRGMDIVQVPLSNPASASYLRFVPAGDPSMPPEMHHPCHDSAVILGDVMRLACAGVPGAAVYSLDPADGASLDNPKFLYDAVTGGSGIGHSVSFTWDGEYLVVGHEPGGGSGARCQATSPPVERTFFIHDVESGAQVGTFTIPRTQTATENCTTHNYNLVPTDKRYVMVSGNYQSGISVIDFTNPAAAKEIAFADPAPIVNPDNPAAIELGGDWSTYWYNGHLYEGDILRGLMIWNLSDSAVAGAKRLTHLNPQTQEFSFPSKR